MCVRPPLASFGHMQRNPKQSCHPRKDRNSSAVVVYTELLGGPVPVAHTPPLYHYIWDTPMAILALCVVCGSALHPPPQTTTEQNSGAGMARVVNNSGSSSRSCAHRITGTAPQRVYSATLPICHCRGKLTMGPA